MTDIKALADAIAKAGDDPRIRLRQGVIQTVNANGSANVTIAGSTTVISNIHVASHACPLPGASCFLLTDGRDWIIMATLAPYGPAYAQMRQNAAQSIANSSFAALDWTTRADTMSAGMTIGNSGFTCVVPGLYDVNFSAVFAANATGQRHAYIQHNGATEFAGFSTNAPGTGDICRMNVTCVIKLAIGDTVNGVMYQSSGGALSTQIGTGANILRATWLGPAA